MDSALKADTQHTATFRPSFFFWMTLLMAFFVFSGFGMTYWYPMASGTFPPAPPVVHLHGMVYSLWMILLVVQAGLVNVRNISLHRSLGMFGIALATAVIFMGALITLLGSRGNPDGINYNNGIYLGIMAVVGFALFFTLAIRNIRKPEIHRRLILFAMLPILPPGIHRLYMIPLGLQSFPVMAMYLTLDAMAAAIVYHEWRNTKSISRYTWFGVIWLVIQQLLHATVVQTDAMNELFQQIAALVYYRV